MKKIALLFGLLLATPAFAADNAVIVTPGVGVTMKSKDIGAGVQAMQPILSDASGNTLLTTLGADAVSNTLTGIPVYSRQLFFNGTTWDRWQGAVTVTGGATSALQSSAAAAKGEGATGAAVPSGAQYGGMNVGGNLTGLAGISAGADAISNTNNQLLQGAFNYFYNGTTWDRIRGTVAGGMLVNVSNTLAAMANNADGVAASTANASPVGAFPFLWNGTTWDRWKSAGATGVAAVRQSDGTNVAQINPCQSEVQTTVPFTLATAAVKVAITGVSAKKIYVCAYDLNNNAADSVAIFEATTATVCATAAVAVIGAGTSVATAATGYNWSANGGVSRGSGGFQVMATSVNANDLCIAQSAATQLSGTFTYVTR